MMHYIAGIYYSDKIKWRKRMKIIIRLLIILIVMR